MRISERELEETPDFAVGRGRPLVHELHEWVAESAGGERNDVALVILLLEERLFEQVLLVRGGLSVSAGFGKLTTANIFFWYTFSLLIYHSKYFNYYSNITNSQFIILSSLSKRNNLLTEKNKKQKYDVLLG